MPRALVTDDGYCLLPNALAASFTSVVVVVVVVLVVIGVALAILVLFEINSFMGLFIKTFYNSADSSMTIRASLSLRSYVEVFVLPFIVVVGEGEGIGVRLISLDLAWWSLAL